MSRGVYSALFLFGFIAFSIPILALAHIMKDDRNMSVLLHLNPADAPVEGEPGSLNLTIQDSENKFKGANCDCQVEVLDGARVVMQQAFVPSATNVGVVPITFPRAAVYQVVVTGKPHVAGQFQPFSISFDQRVERGEHASTTRTIFVVLAVMVLAGFAYILFAGI